MLPIEVCGVHVWGGGCPGLETCPPFSCQTDLLLIFPHQVALGGTSEDECSSGLYTHSGECCRTCNLGEGVAQQCGANQTVCEPCLDSE